MSTDAEALIYCLNNGVFGSVLKEIAKTELIRQEKLIQKVFPKTPLANYKPVRSEISDKVFKTVKSASRYLKVHSNTLTIDIRDKIFKYGMYPISKEEYQEYYWGN